MWDSILNGCAWLLAQLAHLVGDWGLAIIIVTLVIRLALFPLQRKQFKSSYDMQKVQPKLQEIQTLYAGDQQKIQEETMKIYQETGFNPLAGCLPHAHPDAYLHHPVPGAALEDRRLRI